MTTDPHDFLVSVLARNEQQIQPFFDKWDKATFDDRHVFLTSNFAKTTAPGFDVEQAAADKPPVTHGCSVCGASHATAEAARACCAERAADSTVLRQVGQGHV